MKEGSMIRIIKEILILGNKKILKEYDFFLLFMEYYLIKR